MLFDPMLMNGKHSWKDGMFLYNPRFQIQFEHYCSGSDLRYLALRVPSGLRVAKAAAKLTRQQRETPTSFVVYIQLKASVM